MPDNVNDKESATAPLATFMQKKSEERNKEKTIFGQENKTQKRLREEKEKEEAEKKKEVEEAKKDSLYKVSKHRAYAFGATKQRAKEVGVLYVLMIGGALILLLLILNVGPILGAIFKAFRGFILKQQSF